jgi:L-alanine-DL-glutamate epimerase-like enolase superfamily enzyme
MKIIKVHVTTLKAPLLMPFRIATGAHYSLDNVLLTLTLADGTKGYGEAAVATHITGETIPETIKHLKIAATYLQGQDIGQCLRLGAYMHSLFTHNMAAVAAVEMALHDALTRSLKMPLWKLWGRIPKRLKSDITLVVGSLEETVTMARQFYGQGFRAFKIKIGQDRDLDVKRIMAVANIVRKSSLILDANQGYNARQTLQLLKELAKQRILIDLIEQPVPKADWEGLKQVTRATKVLVCADESVGTLPHAVKAIKEKAVGAINIKLMKTGLTHAVMIASLARAHGIKLMIGGMMESPLAMTASAHLAAGLGCFDYVDLDTPFFIKDGLKGHPCLQSNGHYDVSVISSGIGIVP